MKIQRGELDKRPVFVGGIVFDGDENELRTEMVRLKKYFMDVCRTVAADYPRDLHYATQDERNNKIVGKVKQDTSYIFW